MTSLTIWQALLHLYKHEARAIKYGAAKSLYPSQVHSSGEPIQKLKGFPGCLAKWTTTTTPLSTF